MKISCLKNIISVLPVLAFLIQPLQIYSTIEDTEQSVIEISKADRARKALKDLDQLINQALEDFQIPGAAVGVLVDGEVVLAKGYGYRDLEKALPVTKKTLFAIGSCTKAFTTFVLGTLVDDGLLEWDKPVIEYIPEFRLWDQHATQKLTVRDLVTHRSGLPRHDFLWYNSDLTMADILPRLRYLEPVCDLRECFHYNNLMYMVAGYLTERITGISWEDVVRSRILQPLGMMNTNFSNDDSQQTDDFSLPYTRKESTVKQIPFRTVQSSAPAGAINSNILDMLRWIQLQLAGGEYEGRRLIKQPTLQEMHSPQITMTEIMSGYPEREEQFIGDYGLGWMIQSYRGHYLLWHNGGIDGFVSCVALLPKDHLGLVVLTNSSGSAIAPSLSKHIIDKILGIGETNWLAEDLEALQKIEKALAEGKQKQQETRKTDTQPSHTLEEYVGKYVHPGYGEMKIDTDRDNLIAIYNAIVTPLDHWHYDVFVGLENPEDPTFEGTKYLFRTDVDGNIEAIEAPLEPNLNNIIFKRKVDEQFTPPEYLQRFIGHYEFDGITINILLQGDHLSLSISGQPQHDLTPLKEATFKVKDLPSFSVHFILDEKSEVIELQMLQPNGIFSFKKQ